MMSKLLSPVDIAYASHALEVDIPSIKAVLEVESRGKGFLPDDRPIILFERHVFRRRLNAANKWTPELERKHPELINSTPGGYRSSLREWDRLADAIDIDRVSAIESASWGLFQIMGYHWPSLCFNSAQEFVNAMYRSEGDQLAAFVKFIRSNKPMHEALKAKDWKEFARRYNGPAYEKNNYDVKLADAYARNSK